jgi:hypothetical protein
MPPIACSLTATDYEARVRELAQLAAGALRSETPIPGGRRFAFEPRPGVETRLRAAIAAEASCCPFLTLTLAVSDRELVLDVTGPADAQPILAELFAG